MGVSPNLETYNVLVKISCKKLRFSEARELLEWMWVWGLKPDVVSYGTVINGLAKSGDLSGALKVFDEMSERGVSPDMRSYNILIDGFFKKCLSSLLINSFRQLRGNGIDGYVITGSNYESLCHHLILFDCSVCKFLSLDNSVVGKVVLWFSTVPICVPPTLVSSVVKAAGGVGVIIAQSPRSILAPCSDDFPCMVVDYELNLAPKYCSTFGQKGKYSSPAVKLSLSRTLVGKPVSTKIAYFSSRGPSSIAPAILKVTRYSCTWCEYISCYFSRGSHYGWGLFLLFRNINGNSSCLSRSCTYQIITPQLVPCRDLISDNHNAWQTDPSGEPIFAEGSSRKLADPFGYGGGLINPNRARNPGLVYDMGTDDYIHYLWAMGYNTSAISQLLDKSTVCPNPPFWM
ncbi:hypothetical protein RHMOL_Rhmol07G0090400 [Rhododendron molle]|uniref:Uncharacterized protein n=1 Tax=Rhododendron molle TaxID=49168 RepID=A0ACC0MZD3_RHOML|nr:hypothetical protein RHMOL_Rhmol07G0090400 [Rhododendron molle]